MASVNCVMIKLSPQSIASLERGVAMENILFAREVTYVISRAYSNCSSHAAVFTLSQSKFITHPCSVSYDEHINNCTRHINLFICHSAAHCNCSDDRADVKQRCINQALRESVHIA